MNTRYREPRRKQSHNAHGLHRTVTVKYPYHPLYDQRLEVVGSRRKVRTEDATLDGLPCGRNRSALFARLSNASMKLSFSFGQMK